MLFSIVTGGVRDETDSVTFWTSVVEAGLRYDEQGPCSCVTDSVTGHAGGVARYAGTVTEHATTATGYAGGVTGHAGGAERRRVA